MKVQVKEIYKCEFCNKLYQVKKACELHEKICFRNPDTKRACFECSHLTKKSMNVLLGYHFDGSESTNNFDLLYCDHKKIFLYPPKVEVKGNALDLGGEFNEPMPKECDDIKMYRNISDYESY